MSRQMHIFATGGDLTTRLNEFETVNQIQYILREMRDDKNFKIIKSLAETNTLGTHKTGHHLTGDSYLILPKDEMLIIDEAFQRNGATKYLVHQIQNPKSVTFEPGGIFNDNYLVCGNLGTASKNVNSIKLYKDFCRVLVKGCKRIKGYYVCPEALNLLQKGFKLVTMHVNESLEYNLKIDSLPQNH